MPENKALLPAGFTAPIGNLWRGIGNLTHAFETVTSMVDDSASTVKNITALSLGAKMKQLAKDLDENGTED